MHDIITRAINLLQETRMYKNKTRTFGRASHLVRFNMFPSLQSLHKLLAFFFKQKFTVKFCISKSNFFILFLTSEKKWFTIFKHLLQQILHKIKKQNLFIQLFLIFCFRNIQTVLFKVTSTKRFLKAGDFNAHIGLNLWNLQQNFV